MITSVFGKPATRGIDLIRGVRSSVIVPAYPTTIPAAAPQVTQNRYSRRANFAQLRHPVTGGRLQVVNTDATLISLSKHLDNLCGHYRTPDDGKVPLMLTRGVTPSSA